MTEIESFIINPNDPNYKLLSMVKIDLNDLRIIIVMLLKDGFTEIGLSDLLWHIKAAQMIDESNTPKEKRRRKEYLDDLDAIGKEIMPDKT